MSKTYFDYEQTIELEQIIVMNTRLLKPVKNNEDIKPYKNQTSKNVGVLLDEAIVIYLDKKGIETIKTWANARKDSEQIKEDIKNTMKIVDSNDSIHIHFLNDEKNENIKRMLNAGLGIDIMVSKNIYAPLPDFDSNGYKCELNDDVTTVSLTPSWVVDLVKYLEENGGISDDTTH